MKEEALTADDVAALLRIGKKKVYDLAKSGDLPSYRVGRKLRFTTSAVARYMASPLEGSLPRGRDTESILSAFPLGRDDPFVLAGTSSAAGALCGLLGQHGLPVTRMPIGSYAALVNVYAGQADAAFIRLYDGKTGMYNIPFMRRLAPGMPAVVVRIAPVTQGFLVARGNPKKLTSWGSLLRDGVTIANRTVGCAARVLLDEHISRMEVHPESLSGYSRMLPSAQATAAEIKTRAADVCIGTKHEARDYGLDFVPLQDGWLDVALRKSNRTERLVRAVRDIAPSPEFARALAGLGYDTSHAGAIVYEC